MMRFLRWLLKLISLGLLGKNKLPQPAPKSIVPLLIFPRLTDDIELGNTVETDGDKYYVSSPWELSSSKVDEAIKAAEDWLTNALGARISWNQVKLIESQFSLADWRSRKIYLIQDEVEHLGLPWTDNYVYLAFVRGMGGYAGGIHYENGTAGYSMVGDVCLEAICEYPEPTTGSALLGDNGWPANSYSLTGQTGAFIHEALHGLDLPHPDGWPEGSQPGWDETLMGHWWNMPNFTNTNGLTQMEVEKVLQWTAS